MVASAGFISPFDTGRAARYGILNTEKDEGHEGPRRTWAVPIDEALQGDSGGLTGWKFSWGLTGWKFSWPPAYEPLMGASRIIISSDLDARAYLLSVAFVCPPC
jgi:hypothetical protein